MGYPTPDLIKGANILQFYTYRIRYYFFSLTFDPLNRYYMKYLIASALTFLFITFFTSCSTEIQDNSPALQGVRDSVLFRTSASRVLNASTGGLIIRGERNTEALNFLIQNQNQSQIALGGSSSNPNIAVYTSLEGVQYSTAFNQASGVVNLTVNGDNTVSGDFKFTAFTPNLTDTVVFSRGFMYRIPFLTGTNQPDGPVETTLDAFTARVNGVIFNPTVISSAINSGVLRVSGQTSNTSTNIFVPLGVAPGTYDMEAGGTYSGTYVNAAGTAVSTSGTLTIVSNNTDDRIMVGEFVFETAEGFTITDGEFTINY